MTSAGKSTILTGRKVFSAGRSEGGRTSALSGTEGRGEGEEAMQENLGERIARIRRERGLTQSQLAERLYVTPQAVSKWERGLSLPDAEMLGGIARVLDVGTDELLGLTAAPPPAGGPKPARRAAYAPLLLSALRRPGLLLSGILCGNDRGAFDDVDAGSAPSRPALSRGADLLSAVQGAPALGLAGAGGPDRPGGVFCPAYGCSAAKRAGGTGYLRNVNSNPSKPRGHSPRWPVCRFARRGS